jgi:type II secretory pathway component PulF
MIRAGEAGGALDVVLQRLNEFMERSRELRDTVKSALIYPAILVGVAVLSVVVLLMWVVPQFSQMFEESGKALPLPTQVVIASGDFFRDYWWAMAAAALRRTHGLCARCKCQPPAIAGTSACLACLWSVIWWGSWRLPGFPARWARCSAMA